MLLAWEFASAFPATSDTTTKASAVRNVFNMRSLLSQGYGEDRASAVPRLRTLAYPEIFEEIEAQGLINS